MVNLGQVKVNIKDQTIPTYINLDSYYLSQAKIGYNKKKEDEKIAIHKEILRVSLEEINV